MLSVSAYWYFIGSCDTVDCSLPSSSVHGIFQTRILEWPFPSPGNLPDPGIKPRSPALQADSLPTELHRNVYVIVVHLLSHVQLFAIPWATEHQASLYITISLSLLKYILYYVYTQMLKYILYIYLCICNSICFLANIDLFISWKKVALWELRNITIFSMSRILASV